MRTLRKKIVSSYAVILLIVASGFLYAVYVLQATGRSVEKVIIENYQSIIAAENMLKIIERATPSSYENFMLTYDDWQKSFEKDLAEFENYYNQAVQGAYLAEESPILEQIHRAYTYYLSLADSILAIKDTPGAEPAEQFSALQEARQNLINFNLRLLEVNHEAILLTNEQTQAAAKRGVIAIVVASIVALVLGITASIKLSREILQPIDRLTTRIKNIRENYLDQKLDFSGDDEIAQLASEFNKMTERLLSYEKANLQKIVSEKNKSEAIVESIADPLLVTDAEGKLILVNKAAESKLGISNSWVNQPIEDVIRDQMLKDILRSAPVNKHSDGALATSLKFSHANQTFYFRPRQAKITVPEKGLQGHVTLLEDVTSFQKLDQMKSDFIATISHEFRTPLTSMIMAVDILARQLRGPLNERQQELLQVTKSDIQRLNSLIRNLLAHAKKDFNWNELSLDRVDIRRLINTTLEAFSLVLSERQIQMVCDFEDSLPPLEADHQKLSWAFTNVIDNAIKFSPPGGKITVTAVVEDRHLRLSVSDEGPGITGELRDSIFEWYVQAPVREAKVASIGLGLAVARTVAEAHGGMLNLEPSDAPGSTFSFLIPLQRLSP